MIKFRKLLLSVIPAVTLFTSSVALAGVPTSTERQEITNVLNRILRREVLGGGCKIDRMRASGDRIEIYASAGLSYYPFREDNVQAIYDSIRAVLPVEYSRYKIVLYTDRHDIEDLIPRFHRTKASNEIRFTNQSKHPLVKRLSSQNEPKQGLAGRHIAMWQSHGRYFEADDNIWRWQRPRLWETAEDLFTQSFVLPYLVPMLENAGANVLLPRERDTQNNEIIIDNDEGIDDSRYVEVTGAAKWQAAGTGFAHKRQTYLSGQNPFKDGTTRYVKSITRGKESRAEWWAAVPERGEYAVYVSYESFGSESADEVIYTVHHTGGKSEFSVNQTMGGGMWVYLGHFEFDEGEEKMLVSLSNITNTADKKISADAVKIGGGWGNVARIVPKSMQKDGINYEAMVSEYPRWCEGARYWLQWSGFERDVYSPKEDMDDYKDDYMCRSHWVNAVMGGSERLPKEKGKSIPLDMALAFHSDAGVRTNEDIIGTLGIFYTQNNKGKFEGGADRYLSRELTDLVMTQIVGDIRQTYEPNWSRRGMWNRSYYEARVPAVPTMLLELLSHQNFADMRYGNDPRFKFVVSRAIYKGILRYLSSQYNTPYTVQPLPVENFSAMFASEDSADVILSWSPKRDELEPTANPDYYIVYTRIDNGGFDNGRKVEGTSTRMQQKRGHTYSYRVTAVNKGGESFPSETLSSYRAENERGRVLVVNGFDRVSAPMHIQGDSLAGFYNSWDSGVAHIKDIAFIGEQRNFDRRLSHASNDNDALGSSYSDYETEVVAGNTFDYPALHGRSIAAAGFSFCSTSAHAIERGLVKMEGYKIVDIILGKQHSYSMGRGTSGVKFKVLPEALQDKIRDYTAAGGAVMASGCYIASDLWKGIDSDGEDRAFAREVLHYSFNGDMATRRGEVRTIASPMNMPRIDIRFNREPSTTHYGVESPGCIAPSGRDAYIAMRYPKSNQPAAVCYKGKTYRTFVMAIPFESILDEGQRDKLMLGVLDFLNQSGVSEE